MRRFRPTTVVLLSAIGAAAAPVASALAADMYIVTDLGTLAGPTDTNGPGSQAYGLDDDGTVCGLSVDASPLRDLHPMRWDGTLVDLGLLGADAHGIAFALNASGTSVGVTFTFGSTAPQAVRWLGVSAEGLGAWAARDVNASGVIVGEQGTSPSGGTQHAVRWTDGALLDLGTLGGAHSSAYAISDSGRIVGLSLLGNNSTPRAFLWQSGVMSDLGTLGGSRSSALDITENGWVVGMAERPDGVPHAFRFTLARNGGVTDRADLGELGGGSSIAYAASDAGLVVGTSDWRAFVWEEGVMTDLNTRIPAGAGWLLTHATAVNEAGQIAGRGLHLGNPRAFLLTPTAAADLNGDGVVDGADLGMLLAAWGSGDPDADLNADGIVDGADLGALLAAWTVG